MSTTKILSYHQGSERQWCYGLFVMQTYSLILITFQQSCAEVPWFSWFFISLHLTLRIFWFSKPHLLWRKFKSQKMFHNFWPDFLVLFTKPINILGVPEIGYWEIFAQLQKFQGSVLLENQLFRIMNWWCQGSKTRGHIHIMDIYWFIYLLIP